MDSGVRWKLDRLGLVVLLFDYLTLARIHISMMTGCPTNLELFCVSNGPLFVYIFPFAKHMLRTTIASYPP